MASPLIALIVSHGSWRNRQVLQGVASYAHEHTDWRFALQEFTDRGAVDTWLLRAKPIGAIAEVTSRSMAMTLHRAGVRIVDVLEEHPVPHVPQIVCDDQKLVRLAIDHLLACGVRHLAFVGDESRQYAQRRCGAFREYASLRHLQTCGQEAHALAETAIAMLPGTSLLSAGLSRMADWLGSLPKPVGVLACDDAWGAQVLRACADHGLRVPDDVAVIGVDDDPVFCHISDPPLTSVDSNAEAIGYAAAAMLDGMLRRGESPPPVSFVAPGVVQARGSTDVLSIADPEVAIAVRFLRAHACSGLTAAAAAASLGLSVRTLERMFNRFVGHSPAAELGRVRLERARELLAATDLSVADVARRAGFVHVESFHRAFKRRFGVPPADHRRRTRERPTPGSDQFARRPGRPAPAGRGGRR